MSKQRTLLEGEILNEWEQVHAKATVDQSVSLAGLFRGWMPADFAAQKHRILYIGKQTSGRFDRIGDERLSFNSGSSRFWLFAQQIADKVGCSDQALDCIAWTNISKIALPQVRAEKSLLETLGDLPSRSIEAEIAITDPHLILFVTKDFSNSTVNQVAGTSIDTGWNKSENECRDSTLDDVWWRKRTDMRFVVWMRHPDFAKSNLLDYASSKVADLLSSAR